MNMSSEFVPVWQPPPVPPPPPPTPSGSTLRFPHVYCCQTVRVYQRTAAHCVVGSFSGTSPDGSSKRGGKGDHAEQDSRSGSFFKVLPFEFGPRGPVFPLSLGSSSSFAEKNSAFCGNLVNDGCNQSGELNATSLTRIIVYIIAHKLPATYTMIT